MLVQSLEAKPVGTTIWSELAHVGLVIRLEKRLLAIIVSYAVAIRLFSLVIPLLVRKLTNISVISIQVRRVYRREHCAGTYGPRFEDLRWAPRLTELDDEIDRLPRGLETAVVAGGKLFTKSQILRLLVARAIVTRPLLLVFDGALHNMEPSLRQILLRRLCSKEECWSAIFVTNDPAIGEYVDRRIIVE
jgi:hypothetical protein